MRNEKKDIVFYIANFNDIGGVEQWMYYIAKIYGNRDITVYYKTAASSQLRRLLRYDIKLEKYVPQKGINCRLLIVCYDTKILNSKRVKADRIVEFVHCDFKHFNGKPIFHKRVQEYYACSNLARDSFVELTGLDCKTMYNPIDVDKPKPLLKLIAPTRLGKDKGKIWERMELFAKQLEKYKIPFIFYIFSNADRPTDVKEIAFMQPQLDISSYIKDSTYLVQFSDTEGYAYTINESLCLNVPVLVTNFEVVDEIGIKDGKNGYIIPFEVFEDENYDWKPLIDRIYNKVPHFKYKAKHSKKEWQELLGKPTKKKVYKENIAIICKALIKYNDYYPQYIYKKNGYEIKQYNYSNDRPYMRCNIGDILILDETRANELIGREWVEELGIIDLDKE